MSKFVTYGATETLDNDQKFIIDSDRTGPGSITAKDAASSLLSKWAGFETFEEAVQNTISNNQEFIDRDTAIRSETAELKKKIVTTFPAKDASGAVATFESEFEDAPLKSCIVQVEPVQEGSGDPSPDNIRPITGWTGCEVQRTGINVWDEEWELGLLNSDGSVSSGGRVTSKNYIPVVPNKMYCFSLSDKIYAAGRGAYYDADKNLVQYLGDFPTNFSHNGDRQFALFTVPENASYLKFCTNARYGTTYKNDISINYPSTDHDYHPYTGQTYPITFPTEAGTVYGGYIDPINGELVVDRAFHSFTGDETLAQTRTHVVTARFLQTFENSGYNQNKTCCSHYKTSASISWNALKSGEFMTSGRLVGFYSSSTSDFSAYLSAQNSAGTPVTIVAAFATPIHYPLTPTEIKTLLGINNIWSNTGDTSVEYFMPDVSWYVEKKLRAFQSILAGVEDSSMASKNYSANTYLIFNDDIYRVTKAITAGETIEEGVNVTKTAVAEQLMALAQA